MTYRCQPIQADHYCLKCKRYDAVSDSVFTAVDSTDESCAYVPVDGVMPYKSAGIDLRLIAVRTFEEPK